MSGLRARTSASVRSRDAADVAVEEGFGVRVVADTYPKSLLTKRLRCFPSTLLALLQGGQLKAYGRPGELPPIAPAEGNPRDGAREYLLHNVSGKGAYPGHG